MVEIMSSSLHPYGVKPMGNLSIVNEIRVTQNRRTGSFRILSDELFLEILSFLNGIDLGLLSMSSKINYVFSMTSDLWRDLTLRLSSKHINFIHTWRDTYVQTYMKHISKPFDSSYIHTPIKIDGIYSDYLFRLWTCHSFDIKALCSGFYVHNDIPKISADCLDINTFITLYESKNIPIVIKDATKDWNCLQKWTSEYLQYICNTAQFRATSATAPEAALFTIQEYFQYQSQIHEEVPLYLFERDFLRLVPELRNDFHVPKYFNSSHNPYTDLFHVLGEKQRPDYRWLVAGPKRSGSIFHIDPNQTNAWNVSIHGRKKWIFYPPGVCPPGVVASEDGADVTVPLSTGEWLLTFWSYHLEERHHPDLSRRPLEVITEPGDVMFVPHGYWHMVINLDDTIAITQNYVSVSNLGDCLRFLREKTDQISGIRDRHGEAIDPDEIYTEFITKLPIVLSAEQVQEAINQSYKNPCIDHHEILYKKRKSLLFDKKHKKQLNHSKKKNVSNNNNNNNSNNDNDNNTMNKDSDCINKDTTNGDNIINSAFGFNFTF